MHKKVSEQEAINFHGHLGPYLILGILAGELALKKTGAKKYFGLDVKVYGATQKPKSCLIDGLQLSSGATYGKGNIHKFKAKNIKIIINNLMNDKQVVLKLKDGLIKRLNCLNGHRDSEKFAGKLFKINPRNIFDLK